jgi:hypothetical protein
MLHRCISRHLDPQVLGLFAPLWLDVFGRRRAHHQRLDRRVGDVPAKSSTQPSAAKSSTRRTRLSDYCGDRTGALCLNQRTHVALRFELTRMANSVALRLVVCCHLVWCRWTAPGRSRSVRTCSIAQTLHRRRRAVCTSVRAHAPPTQSRGKPRWPTSHSAIPRHCTRHSTVSTQSAQYPYLSGNEALPSFRACRRRSNTQACNATQRIGAARAAKDGLVLVERAGL